MFSTSQKEKSSEKASDYLFQEKRSSTLSSVLLFAIPAGAWYYTNRITSGEGLLNKALLLCGTILAAFIVIELLMAAIVVLTEQMGTRSANIGKVVLGLIVGLFFLLQ